MFSGKKTSGTSFDRRPRFSDLIEAVRYAISLTRRELTQAGRAPETPSAGAFSRSDSCWARCVVARWLCAAALLVSATATATATDDDAVIGPPDIISDCEQQLTALHAEFRAAELPLRHTHRGRVCGAPQVVVYRGVTGGARYSPAPVVSCGLAIALARFDTLVQDAAQREFGQRVVRIGHIGTYNCRDMARFDLVSEHSFANAIDLASFVLANGRKLTVERDFARPARPAATAASRFLRGLASRAFDEHVFSCVITEFFDPLHHNHIHVDMARYRVDGTR